MSKVTKRIPIGIKETDIPDILRKYRDLELKNTDWTQLSDAPLTSEEKTEYREYRKYLRALPAIWLGKHILNAECMSFNEWKLSPPKYPKGI